MKKFFVNVCSFVAVAVFLVGCSSPVAPATAPAPTPSPVTPASVPISNVPLPTSQDDAWAKVIEAAKKEGKVNVYSFNMPGDVGLAVSKGFEQTYGIKVDIITGGGAALAQRITTERRMAAMVADIMDTNYLQISNIKDDGATVSSADIPVLRETGVWTVEPWTNDPQKHILMHTFAYHAGIMNTNLVKPSDEPKSLKELTLPKWKGRMSSYDVRQNSGLSTWFPTLLNRKLVDQDTVQAIGRNDVKWMPTALDAAYTVVQGEAAIVLLATSQFGAIVASEPSLALKPLTMEEGTVVLNRAVAAVRDGPHPNAAKLLINWLLSKEGQMVFVKAESLTPARKDVPDFTPAALRLTPSRLVVPTLDEEKENTRLFREGWLAKLWGR